MKAEKAIRRQADEIVMNSDGKNHQIEAKGDAAKGLAAAASAVGGFVIGFLLMLLG
ncbi:MAG: hypothetical protein LBQ89_02255 [Treponema sp.]|jgi:hypothetical protein|nr:hypothetical protein [Treponema sp.]